MVRYCRLLNVFQAFSCKIRDPHVFSRSGTKVTVKSTLRSKNYFNLQNGKFLSIVRLSFVLKSSEALPKYGKTQIKSLWGTVKLRSLWTKSLFKNFLIQ